MSNCVSGKSIVGVESAYVAKITDECSGAFVYDTPVRFKNLQIVATTPNILEGSSSADNVTNIKEQKLTSLTMELTFQDINEEMIAYLEDRKIDAATGGVITNVDDIAPKFAFGFKITYSDGTVKYVWVLNTQFSNFSNLSATTRSSDGIEYTPITCTCTCLPTLGDNKDISVSLRSDSTAYVEEVGIHWFDEVKIPTSRTDVIYPPVANGGE